MVQKRRSTDRATAHGKRPAASTAKPKARGPNPNLKTGPRPEVDRGGASAEGVGNAQRAVARRPGATAADLASIARSHVPPTVRSPPSLQELLTRANIRPSRAGACSEYFSVVTHHGELVRTEIHFPQSLRGAILNLIESFRLTCTAGEIAVAWARAAGTATPIALDPIHDRRCARFTLALLIRSAHATETAAPKQLALASLLILEDYEAALRSRVNPDLYPDPQPRFDPNAVQFKGKPIRPFQSMAFDLSAELTRSHPFHERVAAFLHNAALGLWTPESESPLPDDRVIARELLRALQAANEQSNAPHSAGRKPGAAVVMLKLLRKANGGCVNLTALDEELHRLDGRRMKAGYDITSVISQLRKKGFEIDNCEDHPKCYRLPRGGAPTKVLRSQ